jgi:hypothetical protein
MTTDTSATIPTAPGPSRRRLAWLVLAVAAIVIVGAVVALALQPRRSTVTGVVVRVDAVSLTDVRSFELRTGDGQVLTFEIGTLDMTPPGFNPQHLSVHAATAEPVAVTYEDRDGRHVAVRLTDAP